VTTITLRLVSPGSARASLSALNR